MSSANLRAQLRSARVLLLSLLSALLLPGVAAADITLVDHGQPKAVIVIAHEALAAPPEVTDATLNQPHLAPAKIAAAAHDLQVYIEKMSGASLPIIGDDQAPPPGAALVLVGRSALTKEFDDKIPSGRTPNCGDEGYALITRGNRLLVAGNDEPIYHGTEYAAGALLHRLGVRWYMPGDFGDFVPKRDTIKVADLDIVSRPDFKLRNWGFGLQAADLGRIEYRWKIRNGMNPERDMIDIPSDGGTRLVLPPPADLNNKAFSEVWGRTADGKPNIGMPNLTSTNSVHYAAEKIKAAFRKDPKMLSWGISGDDGMPIDYSPSTMAVNLHMQDLLGQNGIPADVTITDEWMKWIQAISAEVRRDFPDHFLATNGYANRNVPPLTIDKPDPSIWIMFADIACDTMHSYDSPRSWQALQQGQMIRRWTSMYKNVFIYDYIYYTLWGCGAPISLAHKHMHDMPLLKKWGVAGFWDEGPTVRGITGVFPTYLRARMMWDADLDAKKEMDEFFTNWYGPAKEPAMAFWEELEKAVENTPELGFEDRSLQYVYTPKMVARMEKDIRKAEALATDPWSNARVSADRVTLEQLKDFMAMNQATFDADFSEAARQAQRMMDGRKPATALSRFYFDPDPAYGGKNPVRWGDIDGILGQGAADRRNYFQRMSDLTTGKTGDLVAVLPEKARFKLDPRDDGRYYTWYAADFDDSDWRTVHTTVPFLSQVDGCLDKQGFPWMGNVWYRTDVDVPASAAGKKVYLYAMAADDEAWVWVNGKYAGHRPYVAAFDAPDDVLPFPSYLNIDVSNCLIPGQKNVVAIRVNTGTNALQQAGGINSRLFLCSPHSGEMTGVAAKP